MPNHLPLIFLGGGFTGRLFRHSFYSGEQASIKIQVQARMLHKCVHSVMTGHGHTACFKMLQFGKVLIAEPFLPCRGFLNVATAHGSETVLQSRQRIF